jgi:hypothetical protein
MGSVAYVNTIGIVFVAFFAAIAAAVPDATIIFGLRLAQFCCQRGQAVGLTLGGAMLNRNRLSF